MNKEDSYRYFTENEIFNAIKNNKIHQTDIWYSYLELDNKKRKLVLAGDKLIINKLASTINDNRTQKLLSAYEELNNNGNTDLSAYIVDLENAVIQLFGKPIIGLEETFINKKERDGFILLNYYVLGFRQSEIESMLALTEFSLSQRGISESISKNISRLTSLLNK